MSEAIDLALATAKRSTGQAIADEARLRQMREDAFATGLHVSDPVFFEELDDEWHAQVSHVEEMKAHTRAIYQQWVSVHGEPEAETFTLTKEHLDELHALMQPLIDRAAQRKGAPESLRAHGARTIDEAKKKRDGVTRG